MDPALTIRRVPLDGLHLDPSNARVHGPENLDAIIGSLKRFGQAEPLVVQARTGMSSHHGGGEATGLARRTALATEA